MPKAPATRDVFAELYVAGVLADAGWNVYFPTRDIGFDFIATKVIDAQVVIRPIQVKGKYPTAGKGDVRFYGYGGWLSQLHRDMVLAIAFFTSTRSPAPLHIAYMPFGQVRPHSTDPEWWQSFPATYRAVNQYHAATTESFLTIEGSHLWSPPRFPLKHRETSNQARGCVISRCDAQNRSKKTIETLSGKIKMNYRSSSSV
jgi:hypothetical protein